MLSNYIQHTSAEAYFTIFFLLFSYKISYARRIMFVYTVLVYDRHATTTCWHYIFCVYVTCRWAVFDWWYTKHSKVVHGRIQKTNIYFWNILGIKRHVYRRSSFATTYTRIICERKFPELYIQIINSEKYIPFWKQFKTDSCILFQNKEVTSCKKNSEN